MSVYQLYISHLCGSNTDHADQSIITSVLCIQQVSRQNNIQERQLLLYNYVVLMYIVLIPQVLQMCVS